MVLREERMRLRISPFSLLLASMAGILKLRFRDAVSGQTLNRSGSRR